MEPTTTERWAVRPSGNGLPERRGNEGYRVAVVGATGAVGSTVLKVLHERGFPTRELVPFASPRSVGTPVLLGEQKLECAALTDDAIDGFDLVISSAGGDVSEEWAPKFADKGAFVIDKSSAFRMSDEVPLVVAEVNSDRITSSTRIIASPNCSTMQLVVVLNPIHQAVGIARLVVSTYQSTSGTGQHAIDELAEQSHAMLHGEEHKPPYIYPHRIAFNVLPQVETFVDGDSYTTEERKIMLETRKILGDESLRITATCARVPVVNAHSESVNLETCKELSPEQAREILVGAPGVQVRDDPAAGIYPMASEATGLDDVLVGRIRQDPSNDRTLDLWIVGDNLRKGAALNAVQIAELLHARGLIGARTAA